MPGDVLHRLQERFGIALTDGNFRGVSELRDLDV